MATRGLILRGLYKLFRVLAVAERRSVRPRVPVMGSLALLLWLILLASPVAAKYASLVMDAETGRILHQTNADTRNYPASLTKMMTLYMAFDALDSGDWTLDKQLKVSRRAASQPASRLGLEPGRSITVKQAILGLVTRSANDVATVIAENITGSERSFALHMTAKARRLGMKRTTFRNASGLPHRGQLSTARDMARLARALIRKHARYYHFFSTPRFRYGGRAHDNHNELLHTYEGTDGIKTGYIRASGFNLVASAKRNGQRLIGVVFGGNSSHHRDRHMRSLLDKGFQRLGRDMTFQYKSSTASASTSVPTPQRTPRRLSRSRIWAVQVGAFCRYDQAQKAAREAVALVPKILRYGQVKIVPLKKRNGRTLHRARIYGISKRQAFFVCSYLWKRKKHCLEMRIKTGVQIAKRS